MRPRIGASAYAYGGPWHIRNANAYQAMLKAWLSKFKGIATSYLKSYFGWFRALDGSSKDRLKTVSMLALAVELVIFKLLELKKALPQLNPRARKQ